MFKLWVVSAIGVSRTKQQLTEFDYNSVNLKPVHDNRLLPLTARIYAWWLHIGYYRVRSREVRGKAPARDGDPSALHRKLWARGRVRRGQLARISPRVRFDAVGQVMSWAGFNTVWDSLISICYHNY